MSNKSDHPASFVKMEAARKLMDQGHYRQSLILALAALVQELDNLRTSLLALKTLTRSDSPAAAPPAREEPPLSDTYWLPAVKPRVLH
jgi:uncharacterized protein (DUF2252 family)